MRDALATWPAIDLVSRVRKLPPDSQLAREEAGDLADWSKMAENVARLVDVVEYWLGAEYAKWTADEDEIKQARTNRRKPPPVPLIAPVAQRPPSVQQRLNETYDAMVSEFNVDIGPRMVSDEHLDRLLGL